MVAHTLGDEVELDIIADSTQEMTAMLAHSKGKKGKGKGKNSPVRQISRQTKRHVTSGPQETVRRPQSKDELQDMRSQRSLVRG